MKNKKTLYHFVLDKSGSMSNCRETTLNGFNSQLETIKSLQNEFPEQCFEVSLTVFDHEINPIFSHVRAQNFEYLTSKKYNPSGTTALLDAIGTSINQIRITNESNILNDDMSVVMVILTDGIENASREFTYHQIASTIAQLEKTERWTFTFLGADIDAIHTSKMLNIREENVISFNKSGMKEMMDDISEGMHLYSKSKASGVTKKNFLDFLSNKNRRN